MLRRTPLFVATAPAVVASGLMPDRHPLQSVLWERSAGVRFYEGKVRHCWAPQQYLALGDLPIRGIGQQKLLDGTNVLWVAEGPNIWRWDQMYADRVLAFERWVRDGNNLASPTYYDFSFLGDWAFVNSGRGAVRWWNGGEFATVPQMPLDVVALEKKYNFLMAFGTGDRKTGVSWSDADDVLTWTPAYDNLAGTLYVDDFDTGIRAVSRLGEHNVVYAEDQVALITFIGAPFYFGQRVVLDGIGACGKMAVATNGRMNLGVGRNGIWLTDGSDFQYIDEGQLRDYLQDNVNWEQQQKIIAARNDKTGCFDFFFPMQDSKVLNEGWAFDPRTKGWSLIPAAQFQTERELFQYPLVSFEAGVVSRLEAEEYNTTQLELVTRPLLMQMQSADGLVDVHTDVRLDEIELLCKETAGVEFRLGSVGDAEGTPDWCAWQEVIPGKQTYTLPAYSSNVYHVLEFRGSPTPANVVDGDGLFEIVDGEDDVIDGLDNVVDGIETLPVMDGGLFVIAEGQGWKFDLQGFMLFGTVEGTKRD